MWHYCAFEGSAEQNISGAVFCHAQPAKYAIYFEFEGSTERSIAVTLFSGVFEIVLEHISFPPSFSKAQPSKVWHLLCLETPKERQVWHYRALEGSAEQNMSFAMFSKL